MAHEIFGNRFLDRKAAWHDVGHQNVKEKLRAVEALRKIGGDFNVTMQPLYYTTPDGCQHESSYRQILRYPTEDDPQFAPLGQPVSMDYTPFTPRDVCEAWDKAMTGDLLGDEFVETMGVLRRGATFFITTKLPTIGVRGDEVERYLGVVSPLDGVTALSAEEWPLRVVCANTLRAAQAGALVSFHVPHRGDALKDIGAWLRWSYDKAAANAKQLTAVFEKLADQRIASAIAVEGFKRVYPLPQSPEGTGPAEVIAKRTERFEKAVVRVKRFRKTASDLFEGAGTGMNLPAANHTAWGFLQAVTELEDYRKGSPVGGAEYGKQRESESAMFGSRARAKEIAMIEALLMAGISPKNAPTGLN